MRKKFMFMCLVLMGLGAVAQEKTDPRLELVASFGESQSIGVSVSSDNRGFVSFPRREPYTVGLSEIVNDHGTGFQKIQAA